MEKLTIYLEEIPEWEAKHENYVIVVTYNSEEGYYQELLSFVIVWNAGEWKVGSWKSDEIYKPTPDDIFFAVRAR